VVQGVQEIQAAVSLKRCPTLDQMHWELSEGPIIQFVARRPRSKDCVGNARQRPRVVVVVFEDGTGRSC
jgi:hypothetical protein